MTIKPELLPGTPITEGHPRFPDTTFLQRRRHQLVAEIVKLRQQQILLWSGRYDIDLSYSRIWFARFRAQWHNRPWEVPELLHTEALLTEAKNDYRAGMLGKSEELTNLICEAEELLQDLTLACIAEAEQTCST